MKNDCVICQKHVDGNTAVGGAIYQDDLFYLSHYPMDNQGEAHFGHLILEPKRHITAMEELSEAEQSRFIQLLTKTHLALKKETKAPRIYTFSIGEQVPHLHIHLIPRYEDTPKEFIGARLMEYTGDRTGDQMKVGEFTQCLQGYFAH